METVANPGF